MKTSHALQVTAHPYSLGNPRIYYAKDYTSGVSGVWNNDLYWEVQEINGVVMFVHYEQGEKEIEQRVSENPRCLKETSKCVKKDGKIVGYLPVIKYVCPGEKDRILWQGNTIHPHREYGPDSAATAARQHKFSLKH